jgi:hypothetical protein
MVDAGGDMRSNNALLLGLIFLLTAAVSSACSPQAEVTSTYTLPPAKTEKTELSPQRGLQATDPTSVELAAGKPTLVEFFAYW